MKPLQEYQHKRNFKLTPEPGAKVKKGKEKKRMFVIQEHHASRLHYDFRLEHKGVLKSWSVPKGPSPDPSDKRLAVEVEDHPVDYGKFEGVIPEHEYGGGEVFIWDTGTWIPEGDVDLGFQKGHLDFEMKGKRMKGRWTLVRLHGHSDKPNWLLFKRDDQYANDGSKFVRIKPYGSKKEKDAGAGEVSVTKQMLEDAGTQLPKTKKPLKAAAKEKPKSLSPAAKKTTIKQKKKSVKTSLPEFIEPELSLLVDEAPHEGDWIHEMKFDGYRIQARLENGDVILRTRSSQDWTDKYAATAKILSKLKAKSAIMDGEIVALDRQGKSDFQSLQLAMKNNSSEALVYYVFDLLFLNGEDLREKPLLERKALLQKLIDGLKSPNIHYSEHIDARGDQFFAASCSQDLEGIVSKKADSPYRSGRTQDWVKTKCEKRQEFVIGGFTEAQGARQHFGALLLGVYENQKLRYVGKCGTGFNTKLLSQVYQRLKPLESEESPFDLKSPRERGIHWLKPKLAAEVKFSMWTRDDVLRVPVFQGLREDKDVRDIKKEMPKSMAEVEKKEKTKPMSIAELTQMKSKVKEKLTSRTPPKARTKTLKSEKASEEPLPTITHPEKVLFKKDKVTKGEVAAFYANPLVSQWMLPHIENRPLALKRCPEGAQAECFFQKHLAHLPAKGKNGKGSPLHEIKIQEASGVKGYITIDSLAGLLTLVQMGAYELHSWGCKQPDVEHPDQIVMDFDPSPEVPFSRVKEAALELKKTLDKLKLKSFLKVTGGKGLHVHIPVAPVYSWDQIKGFSKLLADEMSERFPNKYLATMSKAARKNKIFVDYLRNGRSATAVVPYALRAKEQTAVAMPIEWSELAKLKDAAQFTLKKSLEHLKKRKKDPWKGYYEVNQRISILDH